MRLEPVFCDVATAGITPAALPPGPMIDTLQALLRTRMDDDAVAVLSRSGTWTWREHRPKPRPKRRR